VKRIVAAAARGALALAVLAATVFHLRDGRTLVAVDWIRHGDEYVVTLREGTTIIVRQQDVRELEPAGGDALAPRDDDLDHRR